MNHWMYDIDRANSEIRIYDGNSNEISTSPVTLSSNQVQIPADLIPAVAQEFQNEVNETKANDNTDTAISDRAMRIIIILSNTDRNLEPL